MIVQGYGPWRNLISSGNWGYVSKRLNGVLIQNLKTEVLFIYIYAIIQINLQFKM